ncbi:MAG: hypothetical protein ACOCUJ_00350 [Thiohalospira sp.]
MLRIRAEAINPATFLGACGFLEVADRLAPGVRSWWETDELVLQADPSLFAEVEAAIRAAEIEPLEEGDAAFAFKVTGRAITVDYWRLPEDGGNSPWKTHAGQQKAWRTAANLLEALGTLEPPTPETLFETTAAMSGRLGFDPRSGWEAIGAGMSPNEQGLEVATYPYSELLAVLGLQTFLPPFRDRRTRYRTWEQPLPLSLARGAASNALPGVEGRTFEFSRLNRGQAYFVFQYAEEV